MKHFLLSLSFATSSVFAQGPENPPGPPGPTQKSLQEIWDSIEEMQTIILSQENEIRRLRDESRDLLRILPEVGVAGGFDVILDFVSETVDQAGNVGANPSIAFDSSGNVVIAYEDRTNQRIRLARANQSGGWTLHTVVTSTPNGSEPSLGIDSNGKPWIAFRDNTTQVLKVATSSNFNEGGTPTWTITTVDNSGNTGSSPSLVIRTTTRIGIAYRDNTNTRLKYASYNGILWTTEAVPMAGGANYGLSPSLAFTPEGAPAISYYDLSSQSLEYAVKPESSWTLSGIERVSAAGSFNALNFDYTGRPICAYFDQGMTALRYAVFNGASWDKETVATGTVEDISLSVTGENLPVIAFRNVSTNQPDVAAKFRGGWVRGRFPQVVRGAHPVVTVGPLGLPLVAFYETQDDNLIFSTSVRYAFEPSNP